MARLKEDFRQRVNISREKQKAQLFQKTKNSPGWLGFMVQGIECKEVGAEGKLSCRQVRKGLVISNESALTVNTGC